MTTIALVIADDHPLVLKGAAEYLCAGPDLKLARACSNGAEALEAIREFAPTVAVLDLNMPEMSGIEVLRAVAQEGLPTKVIILAGAPGPRDLIMAMAEGAYAFLSKDCQPEELSHAVREAVAGRRTYPFELFGQFQEHARGQTKALPVEKLLTRREWKVMAFAAEGLSNKEIARRLSITAGTAKIHLHHVFQKIGVKNRTALANIAMRMKSRVES
jgi:DNA-binding NarL/FixJ family response regulator